MYARSVENFSREELTTVLFVELRYMLNVLIARAGYQLKTNTAMDAEERCTIDKLRFN